MSLSNSITKLLNFKEDNLIFDENVNFYLNVRFNKITELSLIIV